MDPIKLFTVITLIAIPTVMYGGYSLLSLGLRGKLNDFQRGFFRAGHAHAGVLLVMTLLVLQILGGTEYGDGTRWLVALLLMIGTLLQSGGFFVHMGVGKPGEGWSLGNTMTTVGAVLLAVALIVVAVGVAKT